MTLSALRRLSRDYFEGRLDRSSYQRQRRDLIEQWAAAGEELAHYQPSGPGEFFAHMDGGQASAASLVDAFASREGQPPAEPIVPPAAAAQPSTPGFDGAGPGSGAGDRAADNGGTSESDLVTGPGDELWLRRWAPLVAVLLFLSALLAVLLLIQ